ncbi:PAS domain S-box protein [Pontibacter beigongshangensis]|uniref:PAS domain S-box protein n=1 Tax=Pontibacter beigongshangensis TaxID=2574733 RepID=UPI00164F11D9|nr:PAS domain S-box protein [Pontibacter beigongshangensis]
MKLDKIQHTIFFVFLVTFMVTTFFAAKTFLELKRAYLRADNEVVTLRVLKSVGQLNNNLHEINERYHTYLLTGNREHLDAYTQALTQYSFHLEQLQDVSLADRQGRYWLQQFIRSAEAYESLLKQNLPVTSAASVARPDSLWLEQKAQLLEEASNFVRLIEEQERQNFDANDQERKQETQEALQVLIFFAAGMFVFFVFNFLLIRKTLADRKKNGQALEENQQLFSSLFYQSPVMMTLMDAVTGQIVDVNEAALQFFNNRKEDVIGKVPEELPISLDPEDQQEMSRCLEQHARVKDFEIKMMMANGDEKYMSYSIDKINLRGKSYLLLAYTDVTDKILSQQKLMESEKLFSTLFYKSPVNFYISETATGILVDVNENFLSFFDLSKEEVLGKTTAELQIWDDETAQSLLTANLQRAGEANMELLVRKKNCELRYILLHGEQLQLKGKACMVGAFVDITESKRAEATIKRLNASLEQKVQERTKEISDYKYALDQSAIVAITDQSGDIRHVNNNFCRISGYSRAELIGREHRVIDLATHTQGLLYEMEQAMRLGKIWKGEVKNMAKNGSSYWTDTTIVPFLDEQQQPYQFLSIQWDISDKKKGETALLQAMHDLELSANRLKEAQALAHMGSWDYNFGTGEYSWSDETFRILGTSPQETAPSPEAFIAMVHPDDLPYVQELTDQLSQYLTDSSFICRIIRKDGVERHLSVEYEVVLDEQQNVVRWNGIFQDLTEQILAQKEKDKMTADLTERNKDLQQFNYIISHNLRAPVVNILGLTNLINNLAPGSQQFLDCLSGIRVSVLRLDEVIKDLNSILQVRQEINEAKEYVCLAELVHDVEAILSNRIQHEKATIHTAFKRLDKMYTLKSYLYSIFYNLISNSIKYRKPDQPPVITISGEVAGDKVRLVFQDNGLGIDLAKYGDKVFGLYKRFHFHTEGKGMGLFMVKTQVEILGGRISVESEDNKGTTFTLEFEAEEVLQAKYGEHATFC